LESAHAGAIALSLAKSLPHDTSIVVNMSGRGDKDLFITAPLLRPGEWKAFLARELKEISRSEAAPISSQLSILGAINE